MNIPSRRGFLGGVIALGGAASLPLRAEAESVAQAGTPAPVDLTATDTLQVNTKVNGVACAETVGADESTLSLVRERLGLTGAKLGCGQGACGACTVLVDKAPACACLLPAVALEGREVTTVEGLPADLHPVQRAFLAHDAMQCGFCTPGFVMEGAAFMDRWRATYGATEPSDAELAEALAGHVCRCGAQVGIRAAIRDACAGRFDGPEKEAPRYDARAKVTGAAKYTVDVMLPGMLVGKFLRASVPHAEVVSIDVSAAEALPGVKAVKTFVMAGAPIRYEGQALAAVAAQDEATARAALAAIKLELHQRAPVMSAETALAADATIIFPGGEGAASASEGPVLKAPWAGNLRGPTETNLLAKPKRAAKGLAAARAGEGQLIEARYTAHNQAHSCMEPHAAVARWDGDSKLEVWLSTQSVDDMADALCERYGLERANVRVRADHVGGGFGSKAGVDQEMTTAVDLAKLAGAPVRIAFERWEELIVGGNRPEASVNIALAADNDGNLGGLDAEAYNLNGAAVGGSTGLVLRLLYRSKNKDVRDYDVITTTAPGKPFRGPGGPAGLFALEQAVDELALKRAEDPITLRKRWDPNPGRQRLYELALASPLWRERDAQRGEGRLRRGVGVAAAAWPYFLSKGTRVELIGRADGVFVARCACQDMGQGSRSALAWTLSEALGVPRAQIEVQLGDSDAPRGPASAGSRTTPSIVPAAEDAAKQLTEELVELAEDLFGVKGAVMGHGGVDHDGGRLTWAEILARAGERRALGRRRRDDDGYYFATDEFGWGKAWPGAVVMVALEVDTATGRVRATDGWMGLAAGRIMAPPVARSQGLGGFVQGLSYALYEERRLDPKTGLQLTTNLEDYRIIGVGDTPSLEVVFDETPLDGVRGGGAGLAELATIGVAGAVGNAFAHATGTRLRSIPLRPDRVLEALRQ